MKKKPTRDIRRTVRYYLEELNRIEKEMKKLKIDKISDYIRLKTLS